MLRGVLVLATSLALAPALAPSSSAAAPTARAHAQSVPAALPPTPAPAPPAPAPPPPIPPDLRSLERATLALALSSEKFSASVDISGVGAPSGPFGGFASSAAHAAALLAFVTISGEVQFAPPLASFEASLLGVIKIRGRLIGSTLYAYEPFVASIDGDRPWVETKNQPLERGAGGEALELGGTAGSAATQTFGPLIEEINGASSIRELGAATVDGQGTTGFEAAIPLAKLTSTSSAQQRQLAKGLQPLAHLEAFIAADGVPVRLRIRLAVRERHPLHHAEVITQEDLLAINTPIAAVAAPPARQTITDAALKRVFERRARRRSRRLAPPAGGDEREGASASRVAPPK